LPPLSAVDSPTFLQDVINGAVKVEIRIGHRIGELRYDFIGEQIWLELFCRLDGGRDIHLQTPFR
jgi:hypothetical protein